MPLQAAVLADSALDWEQSLMDDGLVTQGEFGWEYGYISNFTGMNGEFFGWHPGSFYWENNTGVIIYWPQGQTPPNEAWGIGGDSSGCRPPMSWNDGAYPWADVDSNHWAAVRRWTSTYTGYIRITGTVERYFPLSLMTGWDVTFYITVNANTLADPTIYRLDIPWNDDAQHAYTVRDVPVRVGDTVSFLVNAVSSNANKSYIRFTATISESPFLTGDIDQDQFVGFDDFSLLASEWGRISCVAPDFCAGADLDQNGEVHLGDLQILADLWMKRPQLPFLPGDIDQDMYIGYGDFAILASEWGRISCVAPDFCAGADLDRNGVVNLIDLQFLAGVWLGCNDPNPPCGYVGPF